MMLTLLCGCSQESLKVSVDKAIDSARKAEIHPEKENNCTKTYYSYYLSKNVGRVSSTELTNTFTIDGNDCVLSLDITSIVARRIYSNIGKYDLVNVGKLADPFYTREGSFTASDGKARPYVIQINENAKHEYGVFIQTTEFVFIANVKTGSLSQTVFEMMMMLRSAVANSDEAVLAYSSDNIISSETNIITLFDEILPESGYVEDYMDRWNNDKTFIIIDTTPIEGGEFGLEDD